MTVQDETATSTHGVLLTDAAAAKAKALLDQEGRDDLALRIAVQPGGCAGLRLCRRGHRVAADDRLVRVVTHISTLFSSSGVAVSITRMTG